MSADRVSQHIQAGQRTAEYKETAAGWRTICLVRAPEVARHQVRPPLARVAAHRTTRERIRDTLDPVWRRLLWAIATRSSLTKARPRRGLYDTSVVRLDGH